MLDIFYTLFSDIVKKQSYLYFSSCSVGSRGARHGFVFTQYESVWLSTHSKRPTWVYYVRQDLIFKFQSVRSCLYFLPLWKILFKNPPEKQKTAFAASR